MRPCTRARRGSRWCPGRPRLGGSCSPSRWAGKVQARVWVSWGARGARQPAGRCEVELFPLTIEVRVNKQNRRGGDIGSVSTTDAPVTSEWRVLERIAELRAQGHSLREIATVLKVEGHLPKHTLTGTPSLVARSRPC